MLDATATRPSWLFRSLTGLLLLAWLVGTALLVWLVLWAGNERLARTSRDVAVQIADAPPGEARLARVVEALSRAKIVDRPRAFSFYLRLIGAVPTLRTGWVAVNRRFSMREQLTRIARGYGTTAVEVVIPEGFTSFDVAARLSRFGVAEHQALLSAMRSPQLLAQLEIAADSAEGYLFPAQYRFMQDSPADRVVARMVATFRARTEALFGPQSPAVLPLSPLSAPQLVTLASIVEREARVPDERPIIAGVFFNRLFDPSFQPKRLQADPTVAYGCLIAGDKVPSCREYDGRHITPAMVRDPDNPYSTYRHDGLPPGPICNPGLASLQAAVHPQPHAYYYFVAKGAGRHAFSTSLGEHNANVHPSE